MYVDAVVAPEDRICRTKPSSAIAAPKGIQLKVIAASKVLRMVGASAWILL
jgi:hypothetical protein